MKIIFIFLAVLFSSNAIGCFVQPEGLGESHELIFSQKVGIGFLLFLLALVFRFFAQKSRLWVPTLFGISFGYLPILQYVLYWEGIAGPGGMCGRPELLEMGNVILVGFSVIALYELIYFVRIRRTNGL
ncbi:hypothetical protein [Shewanella maritima]|uniref:hypothetical protein n=1 Tax=Shewanella maritima TaxID=2520507 RepID=UPI003735FE46